MNCLRLKPEKKIEAREKALAELLNKFSFSALAEAKRKKGYLNKFG